MRLNQGVILYGHRVSVTFHEWFWNHSEAVSLVLSSGTGGSSRQSISGARKAPSDTALAVGNGGSTVTRFVRNVPAVVDIPQHPSTRSAFEAGMETYSTHHGFDAFMLVMPLSTFRLDLIFILLSVTCTSVCIWKPFNNWIRRSVSKVLYLFRGADVIDQAYRKSNGDPFQISTPDRKHHMVTSPRHIEELNKAPLNVLSLHAVAKDFLQPKDTMHGFEWNDVRGVEGTGFVRALRTILTRQLPELLPILDEAIKSQINLQVNKCDKSENSCNVPLYDMCKHIVTHLNCVVFFGEEMIKQDDFFQAAYTFPQESALAAELIRLLPRSISRVVCRWVTKGYAAATILHLRIGEEIKRRLDASKDGTESCSAKNDGLQWIIDTAPKKGAWSVERLVGEVMGIWYGSVHTLSIALTYALLDLYSNPEYIDPLREEALGATLPGRLDPKQLPLLDSFLSESARLSAFESTGVRRQALQPFTFFDGLRVDRGDWVCVPHRSMMRDRGKFSDPLKFHGWRFLKGFGDSGRDFHMTDSSDKWLVWGVGRIQCPGRFYATAVLKLALSRFLKDYDCRLQPFWGDRGIQWRSTIVPKRSLRLVVSERNT